MQKTYTDFLPVACPLDYSLMYREKFLIQLAAIGKMKQAS